VGMFLMGAVLIASCVEVLVAGTAPARVVFSLTTIPQRIKKIEPVLRAIVEVQTRAPDAVYLSIPPSVKQLPPWLVNFNSTSHRPGLLHVLRMEADYGPASKLLAALAEGGEREAGTMIIYGDDDVIYGSKIIEQHVEAQRLASVPTAFGTRKIAVGGGREKEEVLEATGTISVFATAVPEAVFRVQQMRDACRFSDDYWVSHHLVAAGVQLQLLPKCVYDYSLGTWPDSCGIPFQSVPRIQHVQALSEIVLDIDGKAVRTQGGGDWRDQLKRYTECRKILLARQEL